jgi:hypothetical protein
MSASGTSFSAFRTRFYASASSLQGNDPAWQHFAASEDRHGGCLRGLLFAVLLEGAGLLIIGCVVQALRSL